jgi:hypothetical protein
MPLKKPKNLPKIPKSRQKKAENALNAIPEEKPDKIEYLCKAFYGFDETEKKQYCVFALETIAEFTSFAYEISLDVIAEKREILIVLMGLKAMPNMAPNVQPARTDIPFEDLVGEYTIKVVKQDGAINAADFNFNIFKKEIKLLKEYKPKKKNNRLFCKFEVAEDEFSFGE